MEDFPDRREPPSDGDDKANCNVAEVGAAAPPPLPPQTNAPLLQGSGTGGDALRRDRKDDDAGSEDGGLEHDADVRPPPPRAAASRWDAVAVPVLGELRPGEPVIEAELNDDLDKDDDDERRSRRHRWDASALREKDEDDDEALPLPPPPSCGCQCCLLRRGEAPPLPLPCAIELDAPSSQSPPSVVVPAEAVSVVTPLAPDVVVVAEPLHPEEGRVPSQGAAAVAAPNDPAEELVRVLRAQIASQRDVIERLRVSLRRSRRRRRAADRELSAARMERDEAAVPAYVDVPAPRWQTGGWEREVSDVSSEELSGPTTSLRNKSEEMPSVLNAAGDISRETNAAVATTVPDVAHAADHHRRRRRSRRRPRQCKSAPEPPRAGALQRSGPEKVAAPVRPRRIIAADTPIITELNLRGRAPADQRPCRTPLRCEGGRGRAHHTAAAPRMTATGASAFLALRGADGPGSRPY